MSAWRSSKSSPNHKQRVSSSMSRSTNLKCISASGNTLSQHHPVPLLSYDSTSQAHSPISTHQSHPPMLASTIILEILHRVYILSNTEHYGFRLWEAKEHLSLTSEEHIIRMKFHSMCFFPRACGEPMTFWCKELVVWR